MTLDRPLLTDKDLEAMGLGTFKTIQKWRQTGTGPPYILLNRSVRYVPRPSRNGSRSALNIIRLPSTKRRR